MKTLIIKGSEVEKLVSLEDVIDCVENVWRWHGEGKTVMPSKITTDMGGLGVHGWFNSMPSYIAPIDAAGLKLVGGYDDNPQNGLPFIRANVMLTDPKNGHLRALVSGDWISWARTGAQPAVAMKYLAASTDIVTIIGAGQQAMSTVKCISAVHKVKEFRICDIRKEARESFSKDFEGRDFAVTPFASNKDGCLGADVIITLTTANAVLVEEDWCKKGCLVMPMGSFKEVSDDIARKFDKVCLDHIAQGMHRGQFKEMTARGEIKAEDFDAELPDVVAGKKTGRDNPDQRIICQLVGMGSPDLAVAQLVYDRVSASEIKPVEVDLMS